MNELEIEYCEPYTTVYIRRKETAMLPSIRLNNYNNDSFEAKSRNTNISFDTREEAVEMAKKIMEISTSMYEIIVEGDDTFKWWFVFREYNINSLIERHFRKLRETRYNRNGANE